MQQLGDAGCNADISPALTQHGDPADLRQIGCLGKRRAILQKNMGLLLLQLPGLGVHRIDGLLSGGQGDHDRGAPRSLQLTDKPFQLLLQLGLILADGGCLGGRCRCFLRIATG